MKSFFTLVTILVALSRIGAQSFSFAAPGPTLLGSYAMKGIITTDINNDGKRDIVTGDAYGSNVNVFLGNGNAQFLATTSYSLNGNGPIFTAFADFNGDALQDVAIANYNSNYMSVNLATSGGPYTTMPNSTYTIGNQPYCVDVADFNMDNKMDIITCSANGYSLFIFNGNGAGGFTVAPSFPISTPPIPCFIHAGHFNQDNFPDFAYVSAFGNQLYVYINNGAGSFTAAAGSPYSTGTEPRTIAHKDLNSDGFVDFVISNCQSDNIHVFMGSANGSFSVAPGSPISVGDYPYQVAIADFDLNGIEDLAVTSSNNNNLYFLTGIGNGNFTVNASPISVGYMPHSIVTDDFNNDGKFDIVVGDWASPYLHLFVNTSTLCPVYAGISYTSSPNGNVSFSSTSTGTVAGVSYTWNFGNGNTANGNTAATTFSTGIYTVTLTASNSATCSSNSTQTISVCLLSPSFSHSVLPGGQVNFLNTSTGAGSGSLLQWNFGDNSVGLGTSPTHTYANGIYVVTLTVNSNSLCEGSATDTLFICSLAAGYNYTVAQSGQVNFVSTTTGGGPASAYSWNFGDNTIGTGTAVTHNYLPGSYTVTLHINDGQGCNDSISYVVKIEVLTDIDENQPLASINMFPNPADNQYMIELATAKGAEGLRYTMYSVAGAQVLHGRLENHRTNIRTDNLPDGLYVVTLTRGDVVVKTEKLIVRH